MTITSLDTHQNLLDRAPKDIKNTISRQCLANRDVRGIQAVACTSQSNYHYVHNFMDESVKLTKEIAFDSVIAIKYIQKYGFNSDDATAKINKFSMLQCAHECEGVKRAPFPQFPQGINLDKIAKVRKAVYAADSLAAPTSFFSLLHK